MYKTQYQLDADRDQHVAEAEALLETIKTAYPTTAYGAQDRNYALRDALTLLRQAAAHAQKQSTPV